MRRFRLLYHVYFHGSEHPERDKEYYESRHVIKDLYRITGSACMRLSRVVTVCTCLHARLCVNHTDQQKPLRFTLSSFQPDYRISMKSSNDYD